MPDKPLVFDWHMNLADFGLYTLEHLATWTVIDALQVIANWLIIYGLTCLAFAALRRHFRRP